MFDATEIGQIELPDPQGRTARVTIRARSFPGGAPPELPAASEVAVEEEPQPVMTPGLEELLASVRELAIRSKYGTAATFELEKKLFRSIPFADLRDLLRLGHVRLYRRQGKRGVFWAVKPEDPSLVPFAVRPETVRIRIEEAIAAARKGRLPPFYGPVKERFRLGRHRRRGCAPPTGGESCARRFGPTGGSRR